MNAVLRCAACRSTIQASNIPDKLAVFLADWWRDNHEHEGTEK